MLGLLCLVYECHDSNKYSVRILKIHFLSKQDRININAPFSAMELPCYNKNNSFIFIAAMANPANCIMSSDI